MKQLLLALIITVALTNTGFAFGNNNSNVVGQDQIQGQAQEQIQGQAQVSKNTNKNLNLNGNKNTIQNNFTIEDEREYVQPADIKLPTGLTGHNESRKSRGRRYISVKDQIMFSDKWSVKKAELMLQSNSSGAKVNLTKMVSKGDYGATEGVTICGSIKDLPHGKYVEIAIATGRAMKKGNSAMVTAKFVVKGCKLGADYLVIFTENSERRFHHRGLGGGSGGSDATNSPDTVLNGIASFHLGSNRYEEYPFQTGYLLRKIK